jgi:hypothetical protein
MSRKRFPHPIVGLWPWPPLYSRVGSFRTFWTTPRLTAARITAGCKSPVVMFTLARFGCGSAAGLFFFDRPAVHFDDGTSQDPMASGRISSGEGNCIINLLGQRSIESVGRWYYEEPRGTIRE